MWAVPLNGVANPSHILIYDVVNNQWTIEEKATRYIDNWLISSNLTWTALVALGFTYWSSLGSASWGEYVTSQQRIVHANTNGKLYYHGGDSDAGSNFQAYRTEPMISLGNQQKAILNEVWIDLVTGGAFDLDIYYRGGNTVYECSNASFTQLPSINCNQPANPVSYANQAINKAYRYHQIKWGTDVANERFGVNAIILKYTPEGTY